MDYSSFRKDNKEYRGISKVVGKGLQLRPMFYKGRTQINTGVDRITQSLYCIFSTKKGERLMNPDFGTRIYECLFEPNDFVLCDSIKYYAEEDIKLWEKRIDAEVEVTLLDETSVKMEVLYTIKGDPARHSYVFPLNRNLHRLGERL